MGLNRRRLRDASKCVDDLKKRLIRLGYFYGPKGGHESRDEQSNFLEFNRELIDRVKKSPNNAPYSTLLKSGVRKEIDICYTIVTTYKFY